MGRVLQTMLADTPLVKNMDNPAYMEILLNGKTSLEELFAEIGAIPSDEALALQADTERIFPGFKAVIKLPTLLEQMVRLLKKQSNMEKSN